MKVKEKTQTSVRIGCMDGVTASLDTTFVLEVNFFAIQKLLSFFFSLGPTFKFILFSFFLT